MATPPPDRDNLAAGFDDIFQQFFGGQGPGQPGRGADLLQPLVLTVAEARTGCKREVAFTRRTQCPSCTGTGARDGALKTCPACNGARVVKQQQGFFVVQASCPECKARGQLPIARCPDCEDGARQVHETLSVTVPAGVEPGQVLRLAGKGDHGAGGAGHLYLKLEIDAIDQPVPRGDDVVLETRVGLRHLLFGGSIEVETLDGRVAVPVRRGVRDGNRHQLAGKGPVRPATGARPAISGDPYRNLGRGDQIVVFRVAPETARNARTAVALVIGVVLLALFLALR